MTNFTTLTQDTQNRVKNLLKIYDKAYVVFENGEYNVSAGVALKATYAPDHKVIGTYSADEIFTAEERILNYMESFHDYSPQYKGKRDYKMINAIEGKWDTKFKFDADGNIQIA